MGNKVIVSPAALAGLFCCESRQNGSEQWHGVESEYIEVCILSGNINCRGA